MDSTDRPPLALLESVLCLDCSSVYAKPTRGGTRTSNPGCPYCGYVGWVPLTTPALPDAAQRRFAEDLPRFRSARRR